MLAGVDQVLICPGLIATSLCGGFVAYAGSGLVVMLVGNAVIALTVTLISRLSINLGSPIYS